MRRNIQPRESSVERYLKRKVKAVGGRTFKLKFLGMRGAPDRLVVFPWEYAAFLELKRHPKRKLDPLQAHVGAILQRGGLRFYALGSTAQIDSFMDLAMAHNLLYF